MSITKLQSKKKALRQAPSRPRLQHVLDDAGNDIEFLGGVTSDATPNLEGAGEDGSIITVYANGDLLGTTPCNGNWEFTPDDDLADGVYTFTATATSVGGISDPSREPNSITIDTQAPAQPVIRDVIDNVGPVTGPIPPNGSTDDPTPTFGGGGLDAGDTVFIYDNSVLIGSTTVRGDGTWEFTPDPSDPLGAGNHSVVVVVEDEAGNPSEPSDSWDFVVDLGPPDPPVIDTILDTQGPDTGNLPNPAVTDDTRPILRGEDLTTDFIVEVRANDQPLGTAVVFPDGSWEFRPATDLIDGTYTFTAIVTDLQGRPSAPSEPWVVEVDTEAPDSGNDARELIDDRGPITGPIVSGDTTDDNTPTYQGIAEPGSTVVIYDDGVELDRVPADPVTGRWTFTPLVPLLDGRHQFYTQIIDKASNESPLSMVIDFIIDTAPPEPPVIVVVEDHVADDEITGEIARGGTTDDPRPTIHGEAEAGSVVMIYSNGEFIGSTVTDEFFLDWHFTPEFPLLNGLNNLTAVVLSPAGVASFPSNGYAIIVNAGGKAPVVTITNVLDAVEPQTGNVPPEGYTNDPFPTIAGTSPPGDFVRVYFGSVLVGTDMADDDGNWRVSPTNGLSVGRNEITATSAPATDLTNEGPATGPYPVNFDRTAPAPPTLRLEDQVGGVSPITNGTVTDDANPMVIGTAEPGALVIIYDGTTPLGSVQANETTGEWQFRPDRALSEGPHAVSATATDAAGNVSPPSNVVDFTVDTSTLEIAITAVIDTIPPITGPMQPGMSTNDTHPVVEGLSEPLRLVRLYDNPGPDEIGSAIANGLGQWRIPTARPLEEGPHAFTARAQGDDGTMGASTVPFQIFIDVTPPDQPTIGDITDDIGDDQGSIGRPGVTDDTTPTFSGGGLEPGDTVTVIDNGEPIGTTIVKEDGSWSFTPPTPIRNGEHEFTIIVTDPAGNSSQPSDPWPVNVGVVPLPKPVIESITDNFGPITDDLLNPGKTDDDTPTLNGGGLTPGDEVEVSYTNASGTTVLGTAPVLPGGSWTFETPPLDDGVYLFTVVVVAASGGSRSEPSDPWQVTIDTAQPGMAHAVLKDNVGLVQGEIENGGVTDDTKPDYDGIAEENTTVRIFVNGSLVAELPVNDDGTWRYTPANDLDDGQYIYQTQVVNEVGTEGPLSDEFRFTVDTTAPSAPVIARVENRFGDLISNNTGSTNDHSPTVMGTGEVGAIVTVYNNGTIVIGSTTVLADGTWRFTPDTPLTNGIYAFRARQVDPAGNRSALSNTYTVTINAVTLIRPVIDYIRINPDGGILADDGITRDRRPTVQGGINRLGPISSTVVVRYGNTVYASTTSNAGGVWWVSGQPPSLPDGTYDFTATVEDRFGNVSPPSVPKRVIIESRPDLPWIERIVNVEGETLRAGGYWNLEQPLPGFTNDPTPTLIGTSRPNSTVYVMTIGSGSIVRFGSAPVDANGDWTFNPITPALYTIHSLTASPTFTPNYTTYSNAYWIWVDLVAPAAPSMTANDDGGRFIPSPNGVTSDRTPTLRISAEANTTVTVRAGATVLGSFVTPISNVFNFTTPPLVDGVYSFTATATDRAGNIGPASAIYRITIAGT